MKKTFTLLGIIIILITGNAEADWYDSSWVYRQKITINYTEVDSTLTNFPVLINTTDTDLIGHVVQTDDGGDIHERSGTDSERDLLGNW